MRCVSGPSIAPTTSLWTLHAPLLGLNFLTKARIITPAPRASSMETLGIKPGMRQAETQMRLQRGGRCAVQLLLNLLAYTYKTPKARGGQECASNRPPAVPLSPPKSWGSSDSHKPCTLPALSALKAPPDPSQEFCMGIGPGLQLGGGFMPSVRSPLSWLLDPVERHACLYDSQNKCLFNQPRSEVKASLVYCRAY